MTQTNTYDVLIVGGGLAGLSCALHLSKHDCKVLLIEKQSYPHHKVCGEYVSNEVLPYLNSLEIDPFQFGAKKITNFEISSKTGTLLSTKLPLGGFGMSRFALDNLLYEAVSSNIDILFDTVENIDFNTNFQVSTLTKQVFTAEYVVGAFGKRSNIDTALHRPFMQQKSPWLAVKAHYKADFSNDTVGLHNFKGGYCGLSRTETNAVNACYLTTYESFKRFGNIPDFEAAVLSKNPHLKQFYNTATPLFEKPLTISQISFQVKQPVEHHIFMVGDSAGLIHPLCGNGMAMAIHSAKIFAETYLKHRKNGTKDREALENTYTLLWNQTFLKRLHTGRKIQKLLLHPTATSVGFSVAKLFPSIVPSIIKKTHGAPLV
ncbi:NAD(P)/FAD-dependent oxidoreductase [Ulvibacter litoralis]|uniref:Dehydrogenase (Flavoprotein) n=1 Tax=Ulvibacter litoralis TaxID=227084 RepID=A0A1G7FPE9_9FLAO|nr:NAD(P)/FAD-dependent oxidoreductase [Ulvibacter litoralis]GHC50394.1 FAD-dependent oxidoreductase [Ulvibacter litoralis]SDE77525.1 Dehydrogenase (flavoprotein) [Ulvibacter litoralis]